MKKNCMKKILALLVFSLSFSGLQAQSLKDLFLRMPQEVCPTLSEYNRLEIVDNQKNGKFMQTHNLLSKISIMNELTDDYARLTVSPSSIKEMKMLTKGDGQRIIMVISTVRSDSIFDSSIRFYNTDWQPLKATDYMDEPTAEQFRTINTSAQANELTIVSSNPLALRTDGSSKPAEITYTSKVLVWNTEQNRFCDKKE